MVSEALYDPKLLPILRQRETLTRARVFTAASPLDFRYVNPELAPYTSEAAKFIYWGVNEGANLLSLYERGLLELSFVEEILEATTKIDAKTVYFYEYGDREHGIKGINHDVRAYLKRLCELISKEAAPFTHAFKTSYDKINTADAARMRDAILDVIIPALKKLLKILITLAREHAHTVMVGRTHLKHASTVTFGFKLAQFIQRIGRLTVLLEKTARNLRGKLSGPVGTCAPTMIKIRDPRRYERQTLARLNLKPSGYSHQTVMPEYLVEVCEVIVKIAGALGNLADDMRDLERPEIDEIRQPAGEEEGSSSIMAHKINPIKWENVCSLLKEISSRMKARLDDLVSMHERVLTKSASGRFAFEMPELLLTAIKNATRALSKVQVNKEAMLKNLYLTKDQIISDPLNTIFRWHGHPDAHAAAGRIAKIAFENNAFMYDVLLADNELRPYVDKMSKHELALLKDQKKYVGDAPSVAMCISRKWERRLKFAV